MDLGRELRALEVAWPETPAPRLELAPRRRRRRLLVAAALAVAALAAALAVPQSRGAILRFLHLGGVTIQLVERLPAAQDRPLSAGIGPVISRRDAEQALGAPPLLPPLSPQPPLHLSNGIVSVLFAYRGEPVLLSELRSSGGMLLKKLAGGATRVEPVQVQGAQGLWLSGAAHDLFFQGASPRLAGNVLVWEREGVTYRLEGGRLTRQDALRLARSLE